MTKPIDEKKAERHRAKMANRKARQDEEVAGKTVEKGLLIVHTGTGKGKSTAAFGLALRMLGRGKRDRRGAVHQGRLAYGRARRARPSSAIRSPGTRWARASPGRHRISSRDIAAAERAWGKAQELMADPSFDLVILDELNIALRYDYLPLDRVIATLESAPAQSACRRHRAERQAGADRSGRPRHRDDAGEAPFRRRREGAGRHRVLSRMAARALMFQGTGSDVGKSLIVAGLARALVTRGLKVLPFKPQNMSNNAAVTEDGGEIGRAQALQARAARVAPTVHMNPVLLKPQSEVGAQLVVQGKVYGRATAADYQQIKPELMRFVLDSFARLKGEADIVLVEGAGSASEINLRANDIANMGFARAADVPVVLIGDIDRGGVIASLVGTKAVIDADDAALIKASWSTSSAATRRCSPTAWRSSPRRPAGSRSGSFPSSPRRGCCRRRMRSRWTERGQSKPERASRSRSRCCRISPISTISIRSTPSRPSISCGCDRARRFPAMPISSSCRAPRRPSPISPRCAKRASISTSSRISAAAAWCSVFAAAIRCSAARCMTPTGSKGTPGTAAGLGLLDVETTLANGEAAREGRGHLVRRRARSPATRCIWG